MNLNSILSGKKTVAISGHVKPDGDCVGSTLALYNYIKDNFKDIEVSLLLEEIPDIFYFLKNSDKIIHEAGKDKIYDLYFALDCGDARRLGPFADLFLKAKMTACIDHHKSNESFADENMIVPDASSTCELIYDLIDKDLISKDIAECLYTGMVTDTGVFQYSCTGQSTMEAAGFLMKKGIDSARIIEDVFYTKTFTQNLLLAEALLKAKTHFDGKVISSVLYNEDFDKYNSSSKDTEGIVSQLRYTKGVDVAVFIYQSGDDEFKVSLRSKEIVDVSTICHKFGGGGHVRAAGVTMTGKVKEILSLILSEIEKQL